MDLVLQFCHEKLRQSWAKNACNQFRAPEEAKQKSETSNTALHCTGASDKSLVDLPNRAKAEAVLAALPPPSQAVSRARTCEGPNFDGS